MRVREVSIPLGAGRADVALAAALIGQCAAEGKGSYEVAVPAVHAPRVAGELVEMFQAASELAALFGGTDLAHVVRFPHRRGWERIRVEFVPGGEGKGGDRGARA